jgi:hypothetical protein
MSACLHVCMSACLRACELASLRSCKLFSAAVIAHFTWFTHFAARWCSNASLRCYGQCIARALVTTIASGDRGIAVTNANAPLLTLGASLLTLSAPVLTLPVLTPGASVLTPPQDSGCNNERVFVARRSNCWAVFWRVGGVARHRPALPRKSSRAWPNTPRALTKSSRRSGPTMVSEV